MLKVLFTSCLFVVAFVGFGQNESERFEEPVIVYNRQFYGGAHLHSNGLGGFINFGRYKGAKNVNLVGVDVLYMKHEKETKISNQIYREAPSYIYGKLNSFYIIRPSIGKKKVLTEKLRTSGVQVGYSWQFGPTLGLAKPVYLEIGYPEPLIFEYLVAERFDPDQHFVDNIYGRASGLKGLNEMKAYPGASFKFSFNFEYSNFKDRLKGIEVGGVVDAFAQRVPILSEQALTVDQQRAKNHQFFFNFYVNIFFGKKYNNL